MKKLLKWFLILTLASFIIGAVASLFVEPTKADATTESEIEQTRQDSIKSNLSEAYLISVTLIKNSLKAPSTAKFAKYGYGENPATVEFFQDRTYRVRLWVDAQNSFGAMLRNTYQVDLTRANDGFKLKEIKKLN